MLALARWNSATPARVRMQRTVCPSMRLALGSVRGLAIALVPRRRRRARIVRRLRRQVELSRSAAFSRSNASKRASNCTINASLSWALSKMKFGGESIPLSIQIRRRPATPFRACESIRHTCWQQCPNAGNQPPAGQGREQLLQKCRYIVHDKDKFLQLLLDYKLQ